MCIMFFPYQRCEVPQAPQDPQFLTETMAPDALESSGLIRKLVRGGIFSVTFAGLLAQAADVKFLQEENKDVIKIVNGMPKFSFPPLDTFTREEREAVKSAMDLLRLYADSPDNKSESLRLMMDTNQTTIIFSKTDATELLHALPGSDDVRVNNVEALTYFRMIDGRIVKLAFVALDRNIFSSLAHLLELEVHEVAGHLAAEDRSILLRSHKQIEYDAYERSVHVMEWFARQTPETVPLSDEALRMIRDIALPHERYNWYTWGGPYAERPATWELSRAA